MKLMFAISFFFFSYHVAGQAIVERPSSGIDPSKTEEMKRDSELIILSKPKATYPNGDICVQGTVSLKVEFIETGKIGNIVPVTELPNGLTESATRAAGKSVTVFRTVEYSFSIN